MAGHTLSGGDDLEGTYSVFFAGRVVGEVRITRQGLYYRFDCKCRISGDVVCSLNVSCGGKEEKIGILVPVGDSFGLAKTIPVKHFGSGKPEFFLGTKYDQPRLCFAPIYLEEPFAYIERLKDAYLARKEGCLTAVFKEP